MTFLTFVFVFIFGTIIGSFLNVLILRYNTGRSLAGRSACLSCGAKLSWRELIPILSFVIQRGRCKFCEAAISIQYPLVELFTGLLFVAVIFQTGRLGISLYTVYGILYTAYYLLASSLLIAITAYDFRHKIIPNGFVWTFVVASFAQLFIGPALPQLYDFLAGPILALPFVLIWFFSGGKAMGLGDAKLALGAGWMLGLAVGVSAILLSFWIGGLVGLFLLFSRRGGFTMKSEIPLAPFMVAGVFLAYFFQFDFLGIRNLFF
jgi:prepilin signal peptidase PulO-like enzyme (type II secretory pathway)